jgi:predicted acyl esterase
MQRQAAFVIARREDVLCFITSVLEKPVEVTGPVRATLYVDGPPPSSKILQPMPRPIW